MSNIEHCGNRLRPMGIIPILTYKESKILAGLHFIKIHKKSTIIDEHGTVLMAIYYLNKTESEGQRTENLQVKLEKKSKVTEYLDYIYWNIPLIWSVSIYCIY